MTVKFMRSAAAAVLAAALLVVAASVATAADPPIVTVGPVTAPNGAATAAGTVSSGGSADACVNDQHSGANPSASNPNGAAQVNDGSCAAGGGSQTDGTQSTGSQSGSGSQPGNAGEGSSAGGTSETGTQATTVSAADAKGLRIAAIRYTTRRIKRTKRLGVKVTLRDAAGRLVQDAIVSVGGVAGAKTTLSCTRSTYSNALGQAIFKVPVTKKMLGKRLLLRVVGRTPATRARRIGSVRLA